MHLDDPASFAARHFRAAKILGGLFIARFFWRFYVEDVSGVYKLIFFSSLKVEVLNFLRIDLQQDQHYERCSIRPEKFVLRGFI